MSRRAAVRRVARDIYGYRGTKAKRRRKPNPARIAAFEQALRQRMAEGQKQES